MLFSYQYKENCDHLSDQTRTNYVFMSHSNVGNCILKMRLAVYNLYEFLDINTFINEVMLGNFV